MKHGLRRGAFQKYYLVSTSHHWNEFVLSYIGVWLVYQLSLMFTVRDDDGLAY